MTCFVLDKVAASLQVPIEELTAPPKAACRLYRKNELPIRRRGRAWARSLLPDPLGGTEIDRLELPAGGRFTGVPHTPGTREYLACEAGEIELVAGGERWRVSAGDVLVFRGDQKHSYYNPGRGRAVGYSVVVIA